MSTALRTKPATAPSKQKTPTQAASGAAATAFFVLGLKIGKPRQSVFLRMLLSDEVHKQAFQDLCDKGVPAELLGSLLMIICLSARRHGAAPPTILKDEKKGLPVELNRLADMVEDANKSAFAPAKWVNEPHKKIYGLLPNIMRWYAATYLHVERSVDSLRYRRITTAKIYTIQLVALVESLTGTPNYERIATLLTKGFTVTPDVTALLGGKPSHPTPPKFLDAGTLSKLYRSSAGLTPSNFPRRHSAVR